MHLSIIIWNNFRSVILKRINGIWSPYLVSKSKFLQNLKANHNSWWAKNICLFFVIHIVPISLSLKWVPFCYNRGPLNCSIIPGDFSWHESGFISMLVTMKSIHQNRILTLLQCLHLPRFYQEKEAGKLSSESSLPCLANSLSLCMIAANSEHSRNCEPKCTWTVRAHTHTLHLQQC